MSSRNLSRREALKIGSSLLVAGLPRTNVAQPFVQQFSKEALRQRTEQILNFTTSQEFLNELDAVLNAPKEAQLKEAARRFDPKRLEKVGLTPPPNTRISTRVFDEPTAKSTVLGDSGTATTRVFDETGKATVLGDSEPSTTVNISTRGRRPTKLDIDELVDKKKLLQRAQETASSVCVCVGGGACVGVGGGS